MSETFSSIGLKGGIWEGALRGESAPRRIALMLNGRTVGLAEVTQEGPDMWRIRAPLPVDTLSDGAQTYLLIGDDGEGLEGPRPGAVRLGALPMQAGTSLDEDVRAEVDLLRAEIDLIKREFRRLATE